MGLLVPHVFESLFIETSNSSNAGTTNIVGVIYRPNTQPKADIDIFSSTLFDIMDIINNEKKQCVLMGDYNIDLLSYNSHAKTGGFVDNIFSRGFIPQITKPTRVTPSSATLIDHIYTNTISPNSASGIIITDVADHFGVFYAEPNKSRITTNIQKDKRIYSDTNLMKFKQYLDQTDFTPVLNTNCPDDAYNTFMSLYKKAFNTALPLKPVKPNKRYIKKEPWMTTGLLKSMRTKSNLFQKKLKIPSENNIRKYKIYVNMYNKLKREMKTTYFKNMLEANKHDMKNIWKTLKQAIGKSNDKRHFPQTFLVENEKVTDKTKIAQAFNDYFSSIGKTTSQNVPTAENKKFSDYLTNPIMESMFLEPIEESHILEVVKKLRPKTSFGHDEISSKIIKETINNIIQPITHIVNRSFVMGIVPNQLKIAKVIPVYKASNQDELKNYRPISLLPAFSKIFEKIMFQKMMSYLNSKDILYKHQYGFRAKHSTVHPIVHLLNNCAEANNKQPKEMTLSVFCDLSKAFDVISHDILIKKLEHYGLRGIVQQWLNNYLSNRTQYVEFENEKYSIRNIECGVPQGSILGPLLYLIYVNDISNSTSGKILSFADDTSLIITDDNIDNLFENANTELKIFYNWFCAKRLSLNTSKTKFSVLKPATTKYRTNGQKLQINGVSLSQIGNAYEEKCTKFLGVHIDECLTWKYQIKHINSKISKSLFMIKQVKNILPAESLKTLYFSMIHPYLTYGDLAWGNSNQTTMKTTQLLQKRAIRIINKVSYNSHTEPLFKSSKILNLKDQFVYDVILFMYDYSMKNLPSSFDGTFVTNCETQIKYRTRQSKQIHIERCNSQFAGKLPLFAFPKIWNKWSSTIPDYAEQSRSQFKKKVKSCMLANYNAEIKCSNKRCADCS